MQNDIVRQPPVADPPAASPQNPVSDVHIQPGTEAPQSATTSEPATEATEQSVPADTQPTTEMLESVSEAPEEKPATAVHHKKAASGKPMGVIVGAVIVCVALVGLAVYAQISSQDTATTNVPVSQVAPAGTASGDDASAEIDAALADIEAEVPASDMSAELSETTLGL